MTTYQEAANILAYVRHGYRHGLKSSNKKYEDDPDAMTDTDSQKIMRRNSNMILAQQALGPLRAQYGTLSPIQIGHNLVAGQIACGNCYEMACVAAYRLSLIPAAAYVGSIAAPGDHAFCLAGQPKQAWNTVKSMSDAMDVDGAEAWIIDPWMNTCCAVQDYPKSGRQKLLKWTNDGKRISWYNAWVVPTDPRYVQGFLTGPLTFRAG